MRQLIIPLAVTRALENYCPLSAITATESADIRSAYGGFALSWSVSSPRLRFSVIDYELCQVPNAFDNPPTPSRTYQTNIPTYHASCLAKWDSSRKSCSWQFRCQQECLDL